MKQYTVLDLFSGCGGLSLGFQNSGFKILMGIDNCEIALKTFKRNHMDSKIACIDLADISPSDIKDKYKINDVDVIIGGPPCQGFSIAGKRIVEDERNKLYKSFVRIVEYYRPKAFLMENVPNIISMANGVIKDNILKDFYNLEYNVVYKVLLASNFGVPQNRRRAFFVGLKSNENFQFPEPLNVNNLVTSKDAISDLPEFSVSDGTDYPFSAQSDYQLKMRQNSSSIYNHEITAHKEQTVNIISLVPDGGNYKDLPEEYRKTRKVNIAWTRLSSKKPSFTIDTGHRHHFHYKYNRVPTVRESARLQSFPDNFIFLGNKTSQYKQVGNAVPPLLGEVLGYKLKGYLHV